MIDLRLCPGTFLDVVYAILSPEAGSKILAPTPDSSALAEVYALRNPSSQLTLLTGHRAPEATISAANIVVIDEDAKQWLSSTDQQFDYVVASLLCAGDRSRFDGLPTDDRPLTVTDYPDAIVLEFALARLRTGGSALLVADSRFLRYEDPESVFSRLTEMGIGTEAILSVVDPLSERRVPTGGTTLVRLMKGDQREVFVGELSGVAERDGVLVRNLRTRKDADEVRLGRLYPRSGLRPNPYLFLEDRVKIGASGEGLVRNDFETLALEMNAPRSPASGTFDPKPNALYFPVTAERLPVTDPTRLGDPPVDTIQVVFDESRVSALFLEGYLASPLGRLQRAMGCEMVPRGVVTVSSLRRWQLYLPPRETQDEVLKVAAEAQQVAGEAGILARRCWEHPNATHAVLARLGRMHGGVATENWMESLPYPLASVLWYAETAETDSRVWIERMFLFFTALAEFNAALVLGPWLANPSLFGEGSSEKLAELVSSEQLETPSLGTWVTLAEFLGSRIRKALATAPADRRSLLEAFGSDDPSELEVLTSGVVFSVLQQVTQLRNDWPGHGGALTSGVVSYLREELEKSLRRVRDVLSNRWEDIKLVIPGSARFDAGFFQYEADLVMGTRVPFSRVRLSTVRPMQADVMHVCSRLSGLHFQVSPLLILRASQTGHVVCYFYNRKQGPSIRYVSYQYGGEAELVEHFPDAARFLSSVSSSYSVPGHVARGPEATSHP